MKTFCGWTLLLWGLLALAAFLSGGGVPQRFGPIIYGNALLVLTSFLIPAARGVSWRTMDWRWWKPFRWPRVLFAVMFTLLFAALGHFVLQPSVWRHQRSGTLHLLRAGDPRAAFGPSRNLFATAAAAKLLAERAADSEVASPRLASYYREMAEYKRWQLLYFLQHNGRLIRDPAFQASDPRELRGDFSVLPASFSETDAKEHAGLVKEVAEEVASYPPDVERELAVLAAAARRGEADHSRFLVLHEEEAWLTRIVPWMGWLILLLCAALRMPLAPLRRPTQTIAAAAPTTQP